jgi:hypothetical protein
MPRLTIRKVKAELEELSRQLAELKKAPSFLDSAIVRVVDPVPQAFGVRYTGKKAAAG